MINNNTICNKKVFVFGCGNFGIRFLQLYNDRNYTKYFPEFSIEGFIDNNKEKSGEYVCGKKIYLLEEVKNIVKNHEDEYAIIISSIYIAEQIVEQLFHEQMFLKCYLIPRWALEFRISDEIEKNILVEMDICKPILNRVEYRATEYCNLNCKGCYALCGLREGKHADIKAFERDLYQIKKKFSNIGTIKLYGGEPLMNAELYKFIIVARNIFPAADLVIHTNGTLILDQTSGFYDTLRKYSCYIEISQYPPTAVMKKDIIRKLQKENIEFKIRYDSLTFQKRIDLKGRTTEADAIERCPKWFALYEGKLSRCLLWDTLNYLSDCFGDFKVDDARMNDYIDLYTTSLSGREIIDKLQKPTKHCIYCGMVCKEPELYEWRRAEKDDLDSCNSWVMR